MTATLHFPQPKVSSGSAFSHHLFRPLAPASNESDSAAARRIIPNVWSKKLDAALGVRSRK